MSAISAFWRRKVDFPAMLGPVTIAMRPPSPKSPDRSQSLATNGSPATFSAASTTGWRPPSTLKRSIDERAGPVALDSEFGERGGDVDLSERRAEAAQAFAFGEASLPETLEDVEFERERLVGRRRDARLQVDERVGGEAHRAGHRLAMDEGRVERGFQERLARRLLRLDVKPE